MQQEISDQIDLLSEQGNQYFDEENYAAAIGVWQKALSLIPAPQHLHFASQWLEVSIGDAYFFTGDHQKALEHFLNAKSNIEVNAYENPFIMLRLGQTSLENELFEDAKEYLLRAYMFECEEIFGHDDAKYFEFLKQHVALK